MQGGKSESVIPIPLYTTSFCCREPLCAGGLRQSRQRNQNIKAAGFRGIDPRQVSLIVVTHGHRSYGDLALLKENRGPVAAHVDEVEALRRGVNLHLKPTGLSGRLLKPLSGEKKKGPPVEPDILINKELDLKPYGVKGKIVSTPGHTPGSLSIILAGGKAIVGDLLMGGFIFKRKPRYPLFAHDRKRLERSAKMVLKLKPCILYTAHGGPLHPEDVARYIIKKKDRPPRRLRSRNK